MNREIKKQQLKRRMISADEVIPNQNDSEEMQQELRAHSKKIKKRRTKILLILIVLGIIGAVGFRQYQKYYQFSSYSIAWEKPLDYSEGSFVQYISFGSNVLKYSNDGASYINASGEVVWMHSFEMKAPIASTRGDYAAIADRGGNQIYIFNQEGNQGVASTLLPIINISVSGQGVSAVIVEDSQADYIMMYKRDGTVLDISIRGLLGGETGYPLDIALSPDGTQMLGSFVYIDAGVVKSRAAFHNFSEVGKNSSDRLVGGFHENYQSSIIAEVMFFDNIYSCTVADNILVFYSSQNIASPEQIAEIPLEEELRSVFYSDNYLGVIVNTITGEFPTRLDVYQKNGRKLFSQGFHYNYTKAEFDGDYIFLYNENSCQIYNIDGTLKFEQTFDFYLNKIKRGSLWNRFLIIGSQSLQEIKVQ